MKKFPHITHRIDSKIFPNGTEQGAIFRIKNIESKEFIYLSPLTLFKNDILLEKFSAQDIRDIVYTAAWEMFLSEKTYLKEFHKKMAENVP